MDLQTLKYYDVNANELADKYDHVNGGISDYFHLSFEKNGKILDIGCGSGRDLKILHEMGYSSDGVDPCDEFVELCNKDKTGYGSVVKKDFLPELKGIADKSYDGVLCSAVLMHLPKEQLFDASFAIRRILKDNGRFLMSVPLHDETIDSNTKRDTDGRLFNGITPENFQLIFERIGFSLISRWDNDDSLVREHRKWATLLFSLRNSSEIRPIDTIESILNRDKKTETYKLALFRALAEIAVTNYNLAKWQPCGKVKIPIKAVAEKWMEYFWPLVEAGIKQTRDKPSAFEKTMKPLLEYYRGNKGGLTRFSIEYKAGKLPPDAFKFAGKSLKAISSTIWNQPVRHAGGGNFSVFQYDKKDKTIIVGTDIWRELSLTGSWITDASILRWAELASRISKNTIRPSEVIDCLLAVPVPEREVSLAKNLYDSISEKCCVWTNETIKNKYAIDHAIPFCLWKNNDLWNLFPVNQEVNGNKSDKLPTTELIRKRKNNFVFYWESSMNKYPDCFGYEVSKFIGQEVSKLKNGWENILFANFAEAIEITAIQRGVERWQPAAFAATGINEASLHVKPDTKKISEEKSPYNVGEKSRIVKIVSGGQTGADRGGLDAAIELDVPHGGWCPKGRLAEDGAIPDNYKQTETGSKNYVKRTEKNVVDSSATSIFTNGTPTGGSKKTAEFAKKHGKPYICLDTEKPDLETTERLIDWTRNLRNPQIILNVAGSRESKAPGIQKQVAKIVGNLMSKVNEIRKVAPEETPAKIALMFFPDLRIACGAFRTDSSRVDYDAETVEIEDIHGNLDPKRHFLVRATGDSMDVWNLPIRDGDLLLLEFNEGGTVSNQIFAVEYRDEFGGTSYVLKRIVKDALGRYRLVSGNKDYKTKDIPVEPENMFPFARLKKNLFGKK